MTLSPPGRPGPLPVPAADYVDACLELPFFDPEHAALAREAHRWALDALPSLTRQP